MIYLASPFTHDDAAVRRARVEAVRSLTARLLINEKLCVFAPVLYTSSIPDAPIPYEHWTHLNDRMIELCDLFAVFAIPGWSASRGVRYEIALARRLGKTINIMRDDHEDYRHECTEF